MLRGNFPVIPPRVKRMLLAVFLGRGLMAVRQLLLVPVMIWAWGIEYYGAWLILSAIPTVMAMSNLGIGTSARTRATLEFAAHDIWLGKRTIRLGTSMVAVVGTLVVAVVYFGIRWLVQDAYAIRAIVHPSAVVSLLMATTFLQMLVSPFDAIWIGVGRAAFAQHANNILNIFTIIGTVGAVALKGDALTLSLVCLSITLSWAVIYILLSQRAANALQGDAPLATSIASVWQVMRDLVWRGLGYLGSALWQAILFQGSILVAGSLLGASGAALWGAMRVVIRSGSQFLDVIGQTVAPEFQMAFAKCDQKKLKMNYLTAIRVGIATSLLVVVLLLVCGPTVFNLWTRHSFQLPYSAWAIFSVSLLPFSLWWNGAVLHSAVNRPWQVNIFGVFAAVVSVGLMHQFGASGITYFSAFALLFDVMMALFVFPYSLRIVRHREETQVDTKVDAQPKVHSK